MSRCILTLLLALAFLAQSGCAWLQSEAGPTGASAVGLVYYLPMMPVEAVFERKPTQTVDAARAALLVANQRVAGARKTAAAERAAKQQLGLQLGELVAAGLSPSDSAYKEIAIKRSEKAVALARANVELASAVDAAKKVQARLDQARAAAGSKCLDTIRITPLAPRADVGQRYSLSASHAMSRSEKARLVTTSSGLLSSVDAQAADQSSDVIVNLASSVGSIRGRSLSQAAPRACKHKSVSHVLDPTSQKEWKRFTDHVQKVAQVSYHVKASASAPQQADAIGPNAKTRQLQTSDGANRIEGIAYRRILPLELMVCTAKSCPTGTLVDLISIQVPNHSPTEFLPVSVGVFGSTELAARFDNGVLVEADQTRDSELVQIAKVPFDAVKALGSAVSEVLRIRIDQTSQETELSEKELALLEANQALADALEEAGGNSNDEND